MNRQTGNQNGNKNGKKWSSPIITIIYVVGVTLAVGGYVFTEVTKMLIPGLSPLALAAVIGAYMYDHYQNNKDNKDGSLRSQMIILGILLGYCIVIGCLGIGAAIFGK